MAKAGLSLSERIAERAKKKQKQARGGANRAQFLAVKEDVAKALDDQWPVKEIWATLREEGSISFSYDAFMGYVRRLIKPGKADKPSPLPSRQAPLPTPNKPLAAKDDQVSSPVPIPKSTTTAGFQYSPKPKNRREKDNG
ncbi:MULTISPECIES: TraK family protein [Azotobacter]|uniref:Conjugal transfer protein TraK oriT-binding n=1 Tax=Azotobacter chroococcum NCIMB 8003 TaxID=1328314 RepID=A0A0C4WRZ7_9GAMM|nr:MULTISPECIES: TraK family protein [Azotobacter]AJE23496.1 Conjugal transfer protein TraK oriT-binding [Azotobacter chroococcum NCIMB 8003]MDV7210081.1 TraK family protein [Azotobacter beijerinckii]